MRLFSPTSHPVNVDATKELVESLASAAIAKLENRLKPLKGAFAIAADHSARPGDYERNREEARIEFAFAIKEAKGLYDAALEAADFLALAADYLIGEGDFPAKLARAVPPNVAENVRAARTYARAGLIDGKVVSDRMRNSAKRAREVLRKERKNFRRFESVAAIIVSKATLRHSEAIGDKDTADRARAARDRRLDLHRARKEKDTDPAHRPASAPSTPYTPAPPPLGYIDLSAPPHSLFEPDPEPALPMADTPAPAPEPEAPLPEPEAPLPEPPPSEPESPSFPASAPEPLDEAPGPIADDLSPTPAEGWIS